MFDHKPGIYSTKNITFRYLLALSLVALLSISGYILIRVSSMQFAYTIPELINLSGRQRMLSQKLAKQSLLLTQSRTAKMRELYSQKLTETLESWSQGHEEIINSNEKLQDIVDNRKKIQNLFSRIEPHFETLKLATDRILALKSAELAALSLDSTPLQDILQASSLYLKYMDLIVYQYEKESHKRIEIFKNIGTIILFAVLILLAIEAIFIFRPIIKRVRTSYQKLLSTNEQLRLHITLRNQAEEALRESEEKFRAVVENVPNFITMINREYEYMYFNHVAEGLKTQDLLGKSVFDLGLIPEDRHENIKAVFDTVFATGKIGNYETPGYIAPGVMRYYEAKVGPIRENRKIIALIISVMDITERRQMEEALRESEARFRSVVEDQTEIISRFLPDGTFVFVNDVYCRFAGKKKEELLNRTWFPVAHPDDLDLIKSKLESMTPANPLVIIENRVYSGEGELHWMSFINRGFYDNDGNLVEIQSVGRDITHRKQAEREMQDMSDYLNNILSSISPLVTFDSDFRINFVNNSLRKEFGIESQDLAGRDLFDVFKMDLEQANDFRGKLRSSETKIQTGNEFTLEDKIYGYTNFYFANGSGLILQDITELKQLQSRVVNLSAQVLKTQEEERQRVARELHDSVEQMILAAKLNFIGFRNDPESSHDKYNTGLQLIDRAAQELREIYSDLYPSILQHLGLSAAIEWYLKHHLEVNRIKTTLKLDLKEKLPHNLEVILYRIIQEAMSNVLKHSLADQANIDMMQDHRNNIIIKIQDNGVGFSYDNRKTSDGGFGLENIRFRVEELGGTFMIESELNRGTLLQIQIPPDSNKKI